MGIKYRASLGVSDPPVVVMPRRREQWAAKVLEIIVLADRDRAFRAAGGTGAEFKKLNMWRKK